MASGTSIRLDTTLVDFNEMKWERGDITFLYKGDAPLSKDSFFILDNKLGVYQRVKFWEDSNQRPSQEAHLRGHSALFSQPAYLPLSH